jgi:hypothetical protein
MDTTRVADIGNIRFRPIPQQPWLLPVPFSFALPSRRPPAEESK